MVKGSELELGCGGSGGGTLDSGVDAHRVFSVLFRERGKSR